MDIAISILILLIMPFISTGVINRVKAAWAGKKGVPILQSFYDLVKLLKKSEVISNTASFLFRIGPSIYISSVIFSCALVPAVNHKAFFSFPGDFILFIYILALGKLFLIITAMDTGSSFEGMGASREASFSVFVEPAFFIIFGSLALMTGYTSFRQIFILLDQASGVIILIKIITVLTLFEMILAECSRVPVDDPNTHLELTMIHEVMILDNSGPDLAFIQYGTALKMTAISIIISSMIIPSGLGTIHSASLIIAILLGIAVIIGLIESLIARFKLSRVPQFLFFMSSTAMILFSVILFFIKGN
jgi:formate hydrogenlyase subunit 4